MFGRRNDLKDIDIKKGQLMDQMDNVPTGSDDYERAIRNYKALIETENMVRDGRNKRRSERGGFLVKVGTLLVSAAACIGVPLVLADKAYEHDQSLDMKNGTIWNLIGKFKPDK